MTLFTRLVILLRGLISRLVRRATRPDYVLEYTVDQIEGATRKLKLHLAELIVDRQRGDRQLQCLRDEGMGDSELAQQLDTQGQRQDERIRSLRLQLVELENKIVLLKAKRADVAVRSDLVDAREKLHRVLGSLDVGGLEGSLNAIESELAYREDVQRVLDQMNSRPTGAKRITS